MRQLVELGAAQRYIQMLGSRSVRSDIRQINIGGSHARQFNLGLFRSLLQALHSNLVTAQVDTVLLLELAGQIFHNGFIKVIAAQTGVAVGGQHFHHAVADVQNGHIEGAAAQIVNHNLLAGFLFCAVGQGRGGRLVDDALDLQAGDLAGVLGGLALGIVEVSGHSDDRFCDRLSQICLGVFLQLGQNHGADLLRRVCLAVHIDFVIRTHVTLNGCNGAVGVGDSLALCHLTHHAFAGLGESHHRRGGAGSFGVGDHNSFAAFHNGYARVCRTQVNTNNFSHNEFLLKYMKDNCF